MAARLLVALVADRSYLVGVHEPNIRAVSSGRGTVELCGSALDHFVVVLEDVGLGGNNTTAHVSAAAAV